MRSSGTDLPADSAGAAPPDGERAAPSTRKASQHCAFVLGNQAYEKPFDPLDKPRNDAEQIAASLKKLRFKVAQHTDLTRDETLLRFDEFVKANPHCASYLFYYSGHGLQVDGVNYLVPCGLPSGITELDETHLVRLTDLLHALPSDAVTLVFLDACRENPGLQQLDEERRKDASSKGLQAPAPLAPGLAALSQTEQEALMGEAFVAFAAAPNSFAYEGRNGPTSIFTTALLDHIDTADLSLDFIIKRVTTDVEEVSQRAQRPWTSSSLKKPYFFASGSVLWMTANLVGCAALITSIALHPVANFYRASKTEVLFLTAVSVALLLFLLRSIHLSYRYLREGGHETYRGSGLGRSFVAGFCGGLFAGIIVAVAYELAWPQIYARDKLTAPFGSLLAEIVGGAIFAGTVLACLTYGLARRFPPVLFGLRLGPSAPLAGAMLGGVLTGVLTGPALAYHFGSMDRPVVSMWAMLAGGFIGVAIQIFFIVSYRIERASVRRLGKIFGASLVGTLMAVVISGLVYLLAGRWLQTQMGNMLAGNDPATLLWAGTVFGPFVGLVLGLAVGAALMLLRGEVEAAGPR